jgi:hypothetical protein
VGSGRFGEVVRSHLDEQDASDTVVWGRRLRKASLSDFRIITGKNVIFLDTVDLKSPAIGWSKRLRWLIWPYRVEKALTFYLIRILSNTIIRIHVPAIVDSNAWQRLTSDDSSKSIQLRGFTYQSLFGLVAHISRKHESGGVTASELFRLAKDQDIDIDTILVSSDNFSAQLVTAIPCDE